MKLVRNLLAINLIFMGCITYAQVNTSAQTAPVNLATTISAPVKNNLKIAVVDVTVFERQFLDEVGEKLESQFKGRQADIQKMVNKFKDDQEKLQKDANIMTAEKVEKAKQSLMAQQNQLQVEAKKYDDDLNLKRQQELKVKLDNLIRVVNTISAKNNYDMVLAKNAALFVDQKFDITDEVVKAYKDLTSTKTATDLSKVSNSRIPTKISKT